MAKIIRTEYPIIPRWQKNMTILHASQPVSTTYYYLHAPHNTANVCISN